MVDRQAPKLERKKQIEQVQKKRLEGLKALKEAYLVAIEKDAVVQDIVKHAKFEAGEGIRLSMLEEDADKQAKLINIAAGVNKMLVYIQKMATIADPALGNSTLPQDKVDKQ